MSDDHEFYIGWQEEMPKKNKSFLKKIITALFVAIPILTFLVVWFQKPFNQHQFEFGTLTEVTGTYYDAPLPILIADNGVLPEEHSSNILLVGYGKFGARGIMNAIEEKNSALHGKKITLSGTLIYGDGKTLMELTDEANSLIKIDPQPSNTAPLASKVDINIKGEILDPKCYFGVMKPGEGKVHKSCAIRCISGGIPPVLKYKTDDPKNPFRYYLVLDESGQEINKEILPFVAEQVIAQGKTHQWMDWDFLYVNLDQLKLAKGE